MRAGLDGLSVVVTGAGRGIGREHALTFARLGARVVVNDPGIATDGSSTDDRPAEEVEAEIRAAGGEAVANFDDVSQPEGADAVVDVALQAFGGLDGVVNNAGILRDRMLVNMELDEWDDVVRVHLRSTFLVTRRAARYWRAEAKEGRQRRASVVNTSSVSGLRGIVGQTNYGAAKAGVLTFTLVAAAELARYGVRVNAICPVARTRLSLGSPGTRDVVADVGREDFDPYDPANVASLAAFLLDPSCPASGEVFSVGGGRFEVHQGWRPLAGVDQQRPFSPADFEQAVESMRLGDNVVFG